MINGKRILALIPARGGSKRLPGKNKLNLAGKPMISWTIEAGLKSQYIDRVVVSTDDSKIALISDQFGKSITFKRPPELALDNTCTMDVILNMLEAIEEEGESYDYLILLQPTSPLRNVQHIDEAIEVLFSKSAYSVVSVSAIDHPIEWTNVLSDDLAMDNFLLESTKGKRSQDFEVRYRINGAIYLCLIKKILAEKSLITQKKSYAYIMDKLSSVDIDDHLDFLVAESVMRLSASTHP